jgi:uncharacterized protein (TIGR03086 family)
MTTTPVPARALHAQAMTAFDAVVRQVQPDQWGLPSPCEGWDVRTLVNHVLGEVRWTAPLLAGQSIADVGDRLEGDLLGDDPLGSWDAGRHEAEEATVDPRIDERLAHLSFGDTPVTDYLNQLTADYLVHSWDLAVAIGADDRLDPELVDAVGSWFGAHAADYRAAGAVAAPVRVAETDDPQRRLLSQFGRDPQQCAALAAVARFGSAFDRGDVDAVMAAMTADCAFESTDPPDGVRYAGQPAVRDAWTEFFRTAGNAAFETEEQFAGGDRVVVRWRYTWAGGHVRGVDVFTTRDGLVAEKLSYVKG